jgi:hypothetical protein
MRWLLCLLAMLFLAIGVYFGLRVMQVPSLGELEANDVLAAIASFTATALGGWLLVQIARET